MKIRLTLLIMFIASISFGQEYYLEPIEVEKGETLWGLAEKHFGDGQKFKTLWTVSRTKGITENPNRIYPGMILYKLSQKPTSKYSKIDYSYFENQYMSLKEDMSIIIGLLNIKFYYEGEWWINILISIFVSFIIGMFVYKLTKNKNDE